MTDKDMAEALRRVAGIERDVHGRPLTASLLDEAAARIEATAGAVEACERIVAHFVTPNQNAIGPGGLFCTMCGRNSKTETHHDNCMVKQAEDAIAKDRGNDKPPAR